MTSHSIPSFVLVVGLAGCASDRPGVRRAVDKATAVLAQDVAGNVLYFASEATLRRW